MKRQGIFSQSLKSLAHTRQNSSKRPLRLNAETLKITMGGVVTETEVIKETVRKSNIDDIISVLPSAALILHKDRPKAVSIKFEAVQLYIRVWKCYATRIKSIV